MQIIVGKYSGFCNGAKNAVTKTNNALDGNAIYSVGEIVHNEVVVNQLKERGLIVKDSIMDIPNNSRVIIRAHGETIDFYKEAKQRDFNLIDLTCGRVKLIHNKILSNKNSFIIIVGKKNHPEVIAHKSYSDDCYVVENKDDIMDAFNSFLASNKKTVYIVSQTTFNSELFDQLVEDIKKVFSNSIVEVDKTICNATSLRQEEAKEIAKNVDKMIVIGGKNSSNTKELEVVASNYCNNVYLIQTKDDLDKEMFNEDDIIGITAGASTPPEVIDDVVNYLDSIYKKVK